MTVSNGVARAQHVEVPLLADKLAEKRKAVWRKRRHAPQPVKKKARKRL